MLGQKLALRKSLYHPPETHHQSPQNHHCPQQQPPPQNRQSHRQNHHQVPHRQNHHGHSGPRLGRLIVFRRVHQLLFYRLVSIRMLRCAQSHLLTIQWLSCFLGCLEHDIRDRISLPYSVCFCARHLSMSRPVI